MSCTQVLSRLAACSLVVTASVAAGLADTVPTDGMVVTSDATFAPGAYYLPNGITIGASGITAQGNNTTFIGAGSGNGLYASGRGNVTVQNLTIESYFDGMHFYDCDDLNVNQCNVWDTPELPEGTIFLNIFDGPNGVFAIYDPDINGWSNSTITTCLSPRSAVRCRRRWDERSAPSGPTGHPSGMSGCASLSSIDIRR